MTKSAIEIRNEKLGKQVVKALEKRSFEAYYVATKEEAQLKALELIPEGDLVSWGGSSTLEEIGLLKKLHECGKYQILDRDQFPASERYEIMRKALLCDTYISSTNGLTEDGQLVNLDGNGNRVAAMTFGPKSVIVVAGMNKVTKDLDTAISRVRNTAAPINCQRFADKKTPCNVTGECGDCTSTDSICAYLVVTRLSKPAKKIKVILVGEDLGF